MIVIHASPMRGRAFQLRPVPNTIEAASLIMARITCGNYKNASYFLRAGMSYTADGARGIRYRAEVVK